MLTATRRRFSRSTSNSRTTFHQAIMQTLETRRLFTGFAPASIAASNITATITTGTAPLDTTGAYTIQPTATGTYAVINPAGGATAGAGTYNYFKTGDNVGDFQYTDSFGVSYNDTLTFTDATDGTYSIAPLIPGGAGAQTGTFTFAAQAAQATPDLTLSIVASPTGTVVAGDKGVAAINVTNAGGAIAAGGVTVRLFISPTGGSNDQTQVTGNPVTRFVHLKPGFGTNVQFRFKYPTVATGDYLFVATVTATPPLVDADASNDANSSTQPVHILAPIVDLEAKTLAMTSVPAGGAISGARAHALFTLKNIGNQILRGGPVTIDLLAADNANGIGATSVLSKPLTRMIHIPVNGMLNVPLTFTIPDVQATTDEFLFATASAVGGTIVETNAINGVDANDFVAAANPLTVHPPVVTLRDVIPTIPPAGVVGGKPGHATVRIFNDGNVLFHGAAPITLDASPDTSLEDGTVLMMRSPVLSIPAKGFRDVPMNFKYPTDLANANYNFVAQTAATNTPVKGTTPPINIAVAASNVAVSSSPVNITQPFVALSGNFGIAPGTAFTVGQVTVLQGTVMNTGNIPATGSYTVQLLASPTGSPSDPDAVPLTAVLTKPMVLGPTHIARFNLRITIPGMLTAGVNYLFVLNFDATNVKKVTDSLFTGVSPMTFVVSS